MEKFPNDIIHKILVISPAITVGRWIQDSPNCATVVRTSEFCKEFHCRIQRNQALIASRFEPNGEPRKWSFKSVNFLQEEDTSLLCTSLCPLYDQSRSSFLNYDYGLLCSGFGTKPVVCNPSNGRFRVLPQPFGEKEEVNSFMGFDSLNGYFKVLATNKETFKVLCISSMIWRPINYTFPHKPATASVCNNGVLYYPAYSSRKSMVLIGFNLETELIEINKIPQEPKFGSFFCEKTIKVDGKVGVCFALDNDSHVVRILENSKKDLWSERLIQMPLSIQSDIHQQSPVSFEGIIAETTVFSQEIGSSKVVYYCHGENSIKHIYQQVGSSQTLIFWDHVNSYMFS